MLTAEQSHDAVSFTHLDCCVPEGAFLWGRQAGRAIKQVPPALLEVSHQRRERQRIGLRTAPWADRRLLRS